MKPKSIQLATRFSLSALALGVLAACGGGSGGDIGIADGGIRGTGSSVGPVSGFGSVFVNGVRFETQDLNAQVQSDDGITTESELDEGMILRIDGEWRDDGTGTADAVEYDDTLRGEIESVTADPSGAGEFVEIVVMGQTVVVGQQTVVKGTTFTKLLSGSGDGLSVRASAWRQEDGSFRASYVGVIESTRDDVEIEGAIDDGSVQPGSFAINGVTVTYDSNVEFGEGVSESDLVAGRLFEVEGDYTSGTLHAREIEREDFRRYSRASDDDIEFTSTIQEAFSSTGSGAQTGEFRMSNLVVRVTEETEFDDGLTVADLKQGILIQVEGEFADDGTVVAEEVDLRESNAELEGAVTNASVNLSERTLAVGGVRIMVTPQTIITDDDDARIKLENLIGFYEVEVEGIEREDDNGNVFLEAVKIEREELETGEDDGFQLTGRLRGMNLFDIDVLGVRINLNVDTEFDGIGRDELQDRVDNRELPVVEVEYDRRTNGTFLAEEIELEEDDDDSSPTAITGCP
ncbi:DUF5666 domain-containing protein [Marinobacter sp.]|uniref:DUF5666 domain-containing protein n=1 Tax=Marinobacter sp. TaxID=50741 RepID=UPI00356154B1